MPENLKRLTLTNFGEPESVIELQEAEPLKPTGKELLINMEASPIHGSDYMYIRGRYFVRPNLPASLGVEGVGRVIKAGPQANPDLLGKRVLLIPEYIYGTWATQVITPDDHVVPVDEDIDPLALAQIGVNGVTAYLLLHDYGRLMPGDWIAQTSANSAVGQYVISLAKLMGIKTLNIVRSDESLEFVKNIGGDAVVQLGNTLQQDIAKALNGNKISLAFDTLGGMYTGNLASFLKDGGTVIGYAGTTGQAPQISPLDIFFRRLSYSGFWVIDWFRKTPKEEIQSVLKKLIDLVFKGELSATVGGTFLLDDFQTALKKGQEEGRSGKYFFTPN